jgi:hypothetical protein
MFKTYNVVCELKREPGPSLAGAAAALFEHLLAVFAPRRFVVAIDHGELSYLSRGERGRWDGEELTNEALTLCPPGEASDLVAELRRALAAANPTKLWVGADGGLLHRAPRTDAPAWYGRWRVQRSLHELIEPSFGWSDEQRAVELRFPNEGYPLTSTELRAQADGDRWIDTGDAAVANREHLRGVLADIPSVLGLSRDDVRWSLQGDTTALGARYPDDARAVDELIASL